MIAQWLYSVYFLHKLHFEERVDMDEKIHSDFFKINTNILLFIKS